MPHAPEDVPGRFARTADGAAGLAFVTLRQEKGSAGEDAAAAWLEKAGMRILARNWRSGSYELDLVCRDGDELVFVEVRLRGKGSLASPEASMTPAKCRSVVKAARAYLSASGEWDVPCRFDLVCVRDAGATFELDYYRHVFDISEIMGSGDAAWQPW